MRGGGIPFKLDLIELLARARRQVAARLGEVTISLPFITIAVSPKDRERQIARELVIRLQDRRVLSARECCDDCIEKSLKSLGEIRQVLVDKRVELAEFQDGPLFLLLDAMALGIRQFMTFEEMIMRSGDDMRPDHSAVARRPVEARQSYFDALELLRGHLSRCLGQVAAIGGTTTFSDGLIVEYQGPWQLAAYKELPSPNSKIKGGAIDDK